MTQENVLKLLEKSKKPLSIREISKKLGIGRSSIESNCHRLRKLNDIKMVKKLIRVSQVAHYFTQSKGGKN